MENILIRDFIWQLRDIENADLWVDKNFEKKSTVYDNTAFERAISGIHSVADIVSNLIEWLKKLSANLKKIKEMLKWAAMPFSTEIMN